MKSSYLAIIIDDSNNYYATVLDYINFCSIFSVQNYYAVSLLSISYFNVETT